MSRTVLHRTIHIVLLLTAGYLIVFSVIGMGRLISVPHPRDPYESGQVVEAARAARGAPVYESPVTGHATHAYGPISPYAFGLIQRVTGPNLYISRAVSLIAAGLICWLLMAWSGIRRHGVSLILLAIGLFSALAPRTSYYFVGHRPDLVALMFAVMACGAFYRAERDRSIGFVAIGCVLMLVGFGFKQTALQVAAIPALAAAFDRPRRWYLPVILLPPLFAGATVIVLMKFAPTIWYYAGVISSRLPFQWERAVGDWWRFLLWTIPYWVLAFVLFRKARVLSDPRVSWSAAALFVSLPASALTIANAGATNNSWLPALFVLFFIALLALDRIVIPWIQEAPTTLQLRRSAIVVLAIVATNATIWKSLGYFPRRAEYHAVVAHAATLQGRVISPEDPTLALLSSGTLGRSIHQELFATIDGRWSIPDYAVADFERANWFIDVVDWGGDPIPADSLQRWGFEKLRSIGQYAVWRRSSSDTADFE